MSITSFILPNLRPFQVYQKLQQTSNRKSAQSVHATAEPSITKKVNTSDITFAAADNTTINAYLSTPEALTDSSAGVVLLSDINGHMTGDTRRVADLLASHSLPTIVPDLFRGDAWPSGKAMDDSFEVWRARHAYERVHSDIRCAVAAFRELGFGKPLGLIGFCFGGGRLMSEISLVAKGVNPAVAAAFYPTRFDPVETGRQAACPLLFVCGDNDPLVPSSVIESLRDTLDTENASMEDCEIIIAEGAGHAFAHRPKTEDDRADSEYLLQRATKWLSQNLL